MKQNKLVLISGLSTAGKSTISYELAKVLPGWIFVDIWKIKEMFDPLALKDRTDLLGISKKVIILMTKEIMSKMHRNIIVQEAKTEFFKKHLRNVIKLNNYQIYSFFLINELKDAIKRDILRDKPTMGIGKKWNEQTWAELIKRKTKENDIVINTSKNNVRKVVDLILREIGEKRRKHPKAHLIRKVW